MTRASWRTPSVVAVLLAGLLSPSSVASASVDAPTVEPAWTAPKAVPKSRMPGPHRSYRVWRGGHSSLPDHTVFRPARLRKVPFRMPIVVWGNGGCRKTNEEYRYFLTRFASYGVFIVANGAPGNPYDPADLGPTQWSGLLSPQPGELIKGIDWAIRQNADRRSPYYRRLDVRRILVMGQSCGGWEATDASSDPRVDSTVIWNSGANPYHPSGVLDLHAPVLFAHGGATDHVWWDAAASYELAAVPAVQASNPAGGHVSWWDDPGDGSPPPTEQQRVPLPLAAHWLAFTLYGSSEGRRFFVGENCGLCTQSGWTVASKNWG